MIYSIWDTPEMKGWSMNFGYNQYLNLHKGMKVSGNAFTEKTYKAFCKMMDEDHERWIEANKDNV